MSACIHFILLQRIDYTTVIGGTCADGCQTLLGDGVSVTFSVKKTSLQLPWCDEDGKKSTGSNDMQFIAHDAPNRAVILRSLRKMCRTGSKFDIRTKKMKFAADCFVRVPEYQSLVDILKLHANQCIAYHWLCNLIALNSEVTANGEIYIRHSVAPFMRILCAPYPILSALPDVATCNHLRSLLLALNEYGDEPLRRNFVSINILLIDHVTDQSPILGRAICELTNLYQRRLPVEIMSLMQILIERVESFLMSMPAFVQQPYVNLPGEEYFKTGMYYPGIPVQRRVPVYDVKGNPSESSCSKLSVYGTKRTSGIFKVNDVIHILYLPHDLTCIEFHLTDLSRF